MEKLETTENKTLKKFQGEVKELVEAEIKRKEMGEEYLDDLSKVNPLELNERDMEMYFFIKCINDKISQNDDGFHVNKFNDYKQEAKKSNNKSRWNFSTYLADRLMEKL